jgi:hypothetical protein
MRFYLVNNPLALTSWVLGDTSTAISIAASANSVSQAVDARKFFRQASTLQVIVTGTGAGKVTIEGSRDGVNNWHSMGDRITSMVAGSYALKLDDSNLSYFHFLRFTFTETGGANAITVKAVLIGQGV